MDRKGLTTSEVRVLYWLANGLTRNELAVEYGISVGTISLHLTNASKKLGTRTVLNAIAVAYRLGLI